MKISIVWILSFELVWMSAALRAEGFTNLNFESANISGYSVGSQIPAASAFPGWTVNADYVGYDNISLSSGSVSLIDSNFPYAGSYQPIQGRYFALLSTPEGESSVLIGQTGLIPGNTASMTFLGSIGDMQITFDGQPLSFSVMSTTTTYTVYGADVSAYAGETGQLLFDDPPFSPPATIDDIEFSNSPVPEPAEFALGWFWAAAFWFRHRRKSSR